MTVTDTGVEAGLSEHDHIVDDEHGYPNFYDFYLPWGLSVALHLRAATPIVVRVHAEERRAVIRFGIGSAQSDLFVDTGQLDRLISVLTAARTRLP